MPISFNEVPTNLRVPLFTAEFDNSGAVDGLTEQEYDTLLMAQKLSTGSASALEPIAITSFEQARRLFGPGSVAAEMVKYYLAANQSTKLTVVALDDLQAGVNAKGSVAVGGLATESGIISLMIGGQNVKVSVSSNEENDEIASNVAQRINEDLDLMVTAAVDTTNSALVNLTAKNKGEHGNDIDVRSNFFQGEANPKGLTLTITALASGAGNPDVDAVWPVIGDDQRILFVSPFTDDENIGKIEVELAKRFGPLNQNEGFHITGVKGTLASLSTKGNTRNSQFTTFMNAPGPVSTFAQAASIAGAVAAAGSIDPARPFQTLILPSVLAPDQSERFTKSERNQLLYEGVGSTYVDGGGNVRIEKVITTYKMNASGSPDESYLTLNTLLVLSRLRFTARARVTSKYPRHKLAANGTRFAAGQAIVTPATMKAELVALFTEWESQGLVEDFAQYKNDLIVEINATNKNRLDVFMSPNLVGQLNNFAAKIAFKL